jgi:HEPN domain-containing protein
VWGTKSFLSTGTYFVAATAAGVAFTLALYVQGQVLRMAKNVRDERDADEFRDSFASIKQAIVEINQRPAQEPPEEPLPREISDALDLAPWPGDFSEADRALEAGIYPAAVVAAAISFEKNLRDAAQAIGLNAKVPLTKLLGNLSPTLNKKSLRDLKSLLRLRNSLVHSRFALSDLTKAQAQEMVSGFKRGAADIEELADRIR